MDVFSQILSLKQEDFCLACAKSFDKGFLLLYLLIMHNSILHVTANYTLPTASFQFPMAENGLIKAVGLWKKHFSLRLYWIDID